MVLCFELFRCSLRRQWTYCLAGLSSSVSIIPSVGPGAVVFNVDSLA
jgi:hypothetical protein